MKRILLIILATALLLCTACSFQAGIGYGLDNGEKISVDFSDKSYAFKMAQDRDFLITKGDEKIADVRFYDAQKGMAFINKEPIFTDNVEEIFDEGTKLKTEGLTEADVVIAAGLPLTWTSGQKKEFANYLKQKETVECVYQHTAYCVHIKDVKIYPQQLNYRAL